MLTSDTIQKIRRIEIRTKRIVQDALSGRYVSAFRGRGMEFEEVRPYMDGDDVRAIDWNVSARAGSPHVKLFREERELTVFVVVDLSASLGFGSRQRTNRELVAEVAATLAFSATRNNDKVGLLLFTDRIERHVPPRKGRRHVLRIIRDLLAHEAEGTGTDMAAAIDEINRVQKRRAVVFVISDFLSQGWERPLAIAAQRHDVIPLCIRDRHEESLPAAGLVQVRDMESGLVRWLDLGSRSGRAAFAAAALQRAETFDHAMRRLKIKPLVLRTDEDFVHPMTEYFERRSGGKMR
ncbi:MAG: DUF58 domain-containing protein [Planctomycetota bacterium]